MPQKLIIKKPAIPAKKFLLIGVKLKQAPAIVSPNKTLVSLIGKAVFFGSAGERVAGKVARIEGTNVIVNLAVPSRDGLLIVSDSELTVKASEIEVTKALMQQKRVARFDAGVAINPVAQGEKRFSIVGGDKGAPVEDYLNVSIEGHASTFGTPTDKDRGGDYVMPGAFDKTLRDFMANPVMLVNHRNSVESIAGSWEKVSVDSAGLGVRGVISNAPDMRSIRFKLVEAHLKGLSIGGIWYYADDNSGIEEAKLFEISLVAIPMNQKTLAHTASIGELDCQKAFAGYWKTHSSLRDAA
jgi:HK97 family phage prohead protease